MKTKIICIIDRSGSMSGILDQSIESFNHFLKDQKEIEYEANIDIILFNTKFEKIVKNKNIKKVNDITKEEYNTDGCTSLYDCIIDTIENELYFLSESPTNRSDKTLCVILTDGLDNHSKYKSENVKMWITEMKEQFKWDFIYLGANQDSFTEASNIGISKGNAVNFSATSDGIKVAYKNISKATSYYRSSSENSENIFEKCKKYI